MAGEKKSRRGCLLAAILLGLPVVLVVCLATLFLVKFVPVRVDVMSLRETAQLEARKLGMGQTLDADLAVTRIVNQAKKRSLPVKRNNVTVTQDGNTWFIDLEYEVTIRFLWMRPQWEIDQRVEGKKRMP